MVFIRLSLTFSISFVSTSSLSEKSFFLKKQLYGGKSLPVAHGSTVMRLLWSKEMNGDTARDTEEADTVGWT
jgi:hypothetical protein